jgi:uncharacterized protein YbjT (DUF2867 family)
MNTRSNTRSALLLGATGMVGGHCLDLLLADDAFSRVIVLGRRAVDRQHPRLEQHTVDFARLDEHASLFSVDDVFCCLGTTIRAAGSQEAFRRVDHDYPLAAARLASGRGAKRFHLVTAMGADPGSRIFYNRVKGEVERAVSALPFEGVALLRPSLLLGERAGRRPAEAAAQGVMGALGFLFVGPLRNYRALPGSAVARALVRLAKDGVRGVRVVESGEIAELGA